jgi:hypothetical protein
VVGAVVVVVAMVVVGAVVVVVVGAAVVVGTAVVVTWAVVGAAVVVGTAVVVTWAVVGAAVVVGTAVAVVVGTTLVVAGVSGTAVSVAPPEQAETNMLRTRNPATARFMPGVFHESRSATQRERVPSGAPAPRKYWKTMGGRL